MKMRNVLIFAIVCMTTTLTALADFTVPSEAQMQAAAGDPAMLDGLLKGASAQEAANVVKVVIARVAAMHLSAAVSGTRLTQIMSTTLTVMPAASHVAFAEILGRTMGADVAFQGQPEVVAATQAALVTAGGTTSGSTIALSFSTAFTTASAAPGNPQGSDRNTPQVGNLYRDQN